MKYKGNNSEIITNVSYGPKSLHHYNAGLRKDYCLCSVPVQVALIIMLFSTVISSPPRTPSYIIEQYGQYRVILTVQWQPPQYDGGAPVNYTITVSPGLSPVTTVSPSALLALPYNVVHTVRIMATNCNGSSSAAMMTIRIGILDQSYIHT